MWPSAGYLCVISSHQLGAVMLKNARNACKQLQRPHVSGLLCRHWDCGCYWCNRHWSQYE